MKSKSKMLILFLHQLVVSNELEILRAFLGQDEIPPSSLVQSRKRCLVSQGWRGGGWWQTPKMVSKNPPKEQQQQQQKKPSERNTRGREVNYSLMNYTKGKKRWQNNLE